METIITKPLDIFETNSILPLCSRFVELGKLYLLSGAAKVGKTAFCLKLLLALRNVGLSNFKPVFISFDSSVDYWQKKLKDKVSEVEFHDIVMHRDPPTMGDIAMALDMKLLDQSYNYIIIDGICAFEEVIGRKHFETILYAIQNFAKSTQTNIIVTTKEKQLFFANHNLVQAKNEGAIEEWHLERPEYLGEVIKEFGDTILEIGKFNC